MIGLVNATEENLYTSLKKSKNAGIKIIIMTEEDYS
jgi:hypothetical protein